MAIETTKPRRPFAAIALAIAAVAMASGLLCGLASPAEAQPFERRQRQSSPDVFNPFQLFTPLFQRRPRERDYRERRAPREYREDRSETVDHSRAPPPDKSNTAATRHVLVMGTSLSDWLAYGLEEIYEERPEIGVVRKNHLMTGLVHFDSKDEKTWPQVARDFLKDQNPDVIVVMLGLEDRQSIRERAKGDKQKDEERAADKPAQPSIAAPEPRPQKAQSFDFRTDQWAEVYAKRIDEMIAVLKSKGAPVIWVGLPAVRGTRSTSDMIYLNDLFRARAERAGIIYVDVWDGFVDESGRYTTYGPDVEGQVRRLRTSEGVYLTRAGARKLAHYVEREIKRVMGTRLQPMAVPTLDESGQPTALGPAARPVAGPIVSLTNAASANELLGGGTRPGVTDPLAVRALVNGAAIVPQRGRADNFFLTPEAAEAAKEAGAAKEAAAKEALAAKEATKAAGTKPAGAKPGSPAKSASASAAAPAAKPLEIHAPVSIIADEPKETTNDGQSAPVSPAGKPVASVDPAPAPVERPDPVPAEPAPHNAAASNAAAAKPAARPAESRSQKSARPTYRRPPPRAARRPPPPIFDPLGLFR